VVTRSLTGHVTEKMRIHYCSVGLDEQRAAITVIAALAKSDDGGGDAKEECAASEAEARTLN